MKREERKNQDSKFSIKIICTLLIVIFSLITACENHWIIGLTEGMWDDEKKPPALIGDGSAANPYLIRTAAQLDAVRHNLSAHYKLTADIDLSGWGEWEPLGYYNVHNGSDPENKSFTGTFDGNGQTISALTINFPTVNDITGNSQGLFGAIGSGGEVKNLGLTGVSIDANYWVGGVAGVNLSGGTVQNCYVTGNVTGTAGVGGVVGNNYSLIKNCYSTVNVTGTKKPGNTPANEINIGGVAGTTSASGTISYCYSTGTVKSENNTTAGISAGNGGKIENCVALNPSVSSTIIINIGRVTGYGSGTNNYARSDMGGNTSQFDGNTATGKDGEDITSAKWGDLAWWTSIGFTDPWWSGKLPPTVPPTP